MTRAVQHVVAGVTMLVTLGWAGVTAGTEDRQRVVREGLAVELRLERGPGVETAGEPTVEGRQATISFRLTDPASGKPMTGLRPAAWIHPRLNVAGGADSCKATVGALVGGSLGQRPAVDLNAFHLLALNDDPSLSVIDPLLGFGGSKLLTLVRLKSPGWDWAMTRDRRHVFVSQPAAGVVAVVDTATWKVVKEVKVGPRPTVLALQGDQKYLWVGVEAGAGGAGGVVAIDTATMKVAARLPAGRGPYALARSTDDRVVFATSAADGTLSVVDVARLEVVRTLPVGPHPVAVAYSEVGQAAYVADRTTGLVTVVDASTHAVRARMQSRPGLVAVRFTPATRFGFAVNHVENVVEVIDPATNRIAHTVDVGTRPIDVAFSDAFAYVRAEATHEITMIPFAGLGSGPRVSVVVVPGGQQAAGAAAQPAGADAIVPAPEAGTVMIANAADQTVYYYKEGMAAAMGSFRNARREPRAVLVVDRSLEEREPGVYTTTAALPAAGEYTVPFVLDAPRVVHCFPLTVKADGTAVSAHAPSLMIESLIDARALHAGENVAVRVKVTDGVRKEPRSDLRDLRLLVVRPGNRQGRAAAESRGDGVYEAKLSLPVAGVYYVYFEVPSLRLRPNQLPFLILRAQPAAGAPSGAGGAS